MLKLAIFVIAAWFASQQSMVESAITYVRSDPFLFSSRKGLETCSSSGSVPTLSNSQISIESVYSDAKDGSKSPAGLKITFNRQLKKGLSDQDVRQEYTLPSAGTESLAPTFDSGTESVQGWLKIAYRTRIVIVIIDRDAGVIIIIVISFSYSVNRPGYDVYLLSSSSFLESSKGLLVDGCPNNEALPWEKSAFSARLRKRQSSDCLELAKQYAELFPNSDAFSFENMLKICESNSQTSTGSFSKNTSDEVQRETLEALRVANELYKEYFSKE